MPIAWKLSERGGRLCDVLSMVPGAVGTKCSHSFKWHSIRLFNSLPQHLRNLTNCSVHDYMCLKIDLTSTYLLYNDNSINARISKLDGDSVQRMALRMKNSVKQAQSKVNNLDANSKR